MSRGAVRLVAMEGAMNVWQDSTGFAEGRAMLDELPQLWSLVVKNSHIEPAPTGKGVVCWYELPSVGTWKCEAHTAREAIRVMLVNVCEILTEGTPKQWPAKWHELASSVSITLAAGSGDSQGEQAKERFKSKPRQETIGVTTSEKLAEHVQYVASKRGIPFAEFARVLTVRGFNDFDNRVYSESSTKLLDELKDKLRQWSSSEGQQWMLRLDPKVAVRIRVAAREYEKSASEFAAMCLAHGMTLGEEEKPRSGYRVG